MAYNKVKIGQTIQESNEIINDNFAESVNIADKGIPEGIATLDSSGKVPSSQLPEIPMTAKDIKMTGYVKPATTSAITGTDTADSAIGKLERKVDDNASATGGMITTLSMQMINAQTSISNINDDIDNLESAITELRTDTDTNAAAIVQAETDIADNAEDIAELDTRITQNESDIVAIDGITDGKINAAKTEIYRNTAGALIAKTEPAQSVTIQPSPNDTSIHTMTIYGNTTQDGTPTPDNPVPIVGVENPTVTIDGQSVTLNGITLYDTDRIEMKDNTVALIQNRKLLTDLDRFVNYAALTNETITSIYTLSDTVPVGEGVGYCNLLPSTNTPATGFFVTQATPSRLYIRNIPNSLTGIDGGLDNNTKVALLKTWLLDKGIQMLYTMGTPIITDITDTPNGQALLAACRHGGTTIEFPYLGDVTYNRDINAVVADIYGLFNALLGG